MITYKREVIKEEWNALIVTDSYKVLKVYYFDIHIGHIEKNNEEWFMWGKDGGEYVLGGLIQREVKESIERVIAELETAKSKEEILVIFNSSAVSDNLLQTLKEIRTPIQPSVEETFNKLIDSYIEVKDELLDYTSEYHDGMFYDIEGYCSVDVEDIDLDCLRLQVGHFKSLLVALKGIEYTYC